MALYICIVESMYSQSVGDYTLLTENPEEVTALRQCIRDYAIHCKQRPEYEYFEQIYRVTTMEGDTCEGLCILDNDLTDILNAGVTEITETEYAVMPPIQKMTFKWALETLPKLGYIRDNYTSCDDEKMSGELPFSIY